MIQVALDSAWQGLHKAWQRFEKQMIRKLTKSARQMRIQVFSGLAMLEQMLFVLPMMDSENALAQ